MASHFLVDKSLSLEARFGGFAADGARPFPEPGAPPRYGPDRGFNIGHITVRLRVDVDARTLLGEADVNILPLPSGLCAVALDLEEQAVQAVELVDENGGTRPLSWRQLPARLCVDGVPATGGTVRVRYAGTPTRGGYFTGPTAAEPNRRPAFWTQCQDEDGHFLFPCLDHPSIKHSFRAEITAPARCEVVGNGALLRKTVAAGWTTWVWDQKDPIPAYLFTTVVQEMTVVEDTGVLDALGGLPVRYLVPKGTDEADIRRIFGRTPQMIALFNQRFGVDYPWARYDQVVVHDFIFGGMENVSATTLTDLVLTDERAALDMDFDDLIAHELAHQWFGDLVTCADWSQAWLNEGWATWSESHWKRHHLGDEDADYGLYLQLTEYLGEHGGRYQRSIVHYAYKNPIDLFDRHLYEKAALVLHTLHTTLGAGAFWSATQRYLRTHRGGTAYTRDFQREMERASGRNLDRFFQQWIHGAGHPELTVSIEHNSEAGTLQLTVAQAQVGDQVAQAFHLPLRVGVVIEGTARVHNLAISERERTWVLSCPSRPDRVEIDANFGVLADLTVSAPRDLLVASLQNDGGAVGRIRAAKALGKEGSAPALTALAGALHTESFWGARVEIAGVLAAAGGRIAREGLLAALGDPHPKARRAIVGALGAFRHPDVAGALRNLAVEGDRSVQVEGEAARSLGRIRADDAVEVGKLALERDSWGEIIRARALEGLGASQRADALPTLLEWTGEDRHPRARAPAATALGRLADEVESVRRPAVDRLMELASDGPFRVRLAAIGALASAGDARAQGVLRRVHQADESGMVRRRAYEASRSIARGRTGEAALENLRQDLEKMRSSERKLRDRLDRLEKSTDSE